MKQYSFLRNTLVIKVSTKSLLSGIFLHGEELDFIFLTSYQGAHGNREINGRQCPRPDRQHPRSSVRNGVFSNRLTEMNPLCNHQNKQENHYVD